MPLLRYSHGPRAGMIPWGMLLLLLGRLGRDAGFDERLNALRGAVLGDGGAEPFLGAFGALAGPRGVAGDVAPRILRTRHTEHGIAVANHAIGALHGAER